MVLLYALLITMYAVSIWLGFSAAITVYLLVWHASHFLTLLAKTVSNIAKAVALLFGAPPKNPRFIAGAVYIAQSVLMETTADSVILDINGLFCDECAWYSAACSQSGIRWHTNSSEQSSALGRATANRLAARTSKSLASFPKHQLCLMAGGGVWLFLVRCGSPGRR